MHKVLILLILIAVSAQSSLVSAEVLPTKVATEQIVNLATTTPQRVTQTEPKKPTFAVERKNYVPGEVIVKYKNDRLSLADSRGISRAMSLAGREAMQPVENFASANISILKITDKESVEQKVRALENDPSVEYAEPNYLYYYQSVLDTEPGGNLLWGLENIGQNVAGISGVADADIDAPQAWQISQGDSRAVVVAVIDEGIAYNHPDLQANMWEGGSCVNEYGVFIGNCVHGFDFVDNDRDPLPIGTHGTHVAGTIAASLGNNIGVAGVAPNAKLMALRTGDINGLTTANIVRAIDFATSNGADVINASFGGPDYSQAVYDAIDRFRAAGGIFVAAAGNASNSNDSDSIYPSNYQLDNIISVAATNQSDGLASFSNYGLTTVDVAAPGVNIYSTVSDTSSLIFENFQSLTTPAIPGDWSKSGTDNNWGTYQFSNGATVLYGDLNAPYLPNADTMVTAGSYDLSGTQASIEFLTQCDTEYSTTGWYDYIALEVSGDGRSYTELLRWDETMLDILSGESPLDPTGSAAFNFTEISIPSEFLTTDFSYQFRWVTNETIEEFDGCFVDSIKITSTDDGSNESYAFSQGTSMATPHVAGLAALLLGYNPDLTGSEVKDIILTTGDTLPSLVGKTATSKRINAYSAMLAAATTSIEQSIAISLSTNSPEAATIEVDEDDRTDGIVIMSFDLAALGGAVGVTNLPITFVTGSSSFTSVIDDVYVEIGASSFNDYSVVGSGTSTTLNFSFAPGEFLVAGNAVAEINVLVDIESQSGNYINGETIQASVSELNVAGINSNPVVAKSGSAVGDTHTLVARGLSVLDVSGTASVIEVDNSLDIAEFTFELDLTAVADDFYIHNDPLPIKYYYADESGVVATNLLPANPSITSSADEDSPGVFTVREGDVETFEFSAQFEPAAAGIYRMHLTELHYQDILGNQYTHQLAPADAFTTPYVTLQAPLGPDTVAPVVMLNGSSSVSLMIGDDYLELGATANDERDGEIDVNISGSVSTTTPGVYEITYTATDTAGNSTSVIRTVSVIDPAGPTFANVPENFAVEATSAAGAIVTYGPVTATDDIDGVVPVLCTPESGATLSISDHPIQCVASDTSGNESVVGFIVSVVDTQAPVLTLLGEAEISIAFGQDYIDSGATAEDLVDGDLTEGIIVTGAVKTGDSGKYMLTYRVADTAGNESQITRTVTVAAEVIPRRSSGGGGGGSSNRRSAPEVEELVLGVITDTPLAALTEEERKIELQKQIILLLTQIIALLNQKLSV